MIDAIAAKYGQRSSLIGHSVGWRVACALFMFDFTLPRGSTSVNMFTFEADDELHQGQRQLLAQPPLASLGRGFARSDFRTLASYRTSRRFGNRRIEERFFDVSHHSVASSFLTSAARAEKLFFLCNPTVD
jgi:hypothetical protein